MCVNTMYMWQSRVEIIPLRISIASLRSKCRISELPLRAGHKHAV